MFNWRLAYHLENSIGSTGVERIRPPGFLNNSKEVTADINVKVEPFLRHFDVHRQIMKGNRRKILEKNKM